MRTRQQINEQIAWLEENRDNVMPYTAFGEDNRAAIDAQLQVLKEGLDYDRIQELVDANRLTESAAESASHAAQWRDDADDEAEPIKNWKVLLQS